MVGKKKRVELPEEVVARAKAFGGSIPVEEVFEAALSVAMDNGTVLRKRLEVLREIRSASAAKATESFAGEASPE